MQHTARVLAPDASCKPINPVDREFLLFAAGNRPERHDQPIAEHRNGAMLAPIWLRAAHRGVPNFLVTALVLGQRMGTAVGTALIPSILYALTEAGFHWNLGIIAAFSAIILTLSSGLAFTIADRRLEVRETASS